MAKGEDVQIESTFVPEVEAKPTTMCRCEDLLQLSQVKHVKHMFVADSAIEVL